MQSLLTASVILIPAAYALLVTVQFVLGAFVLWQRSQSATVRAVKPEATTPIIHPVIEPETKLRVVTLPTAEPELLATFAPELVSPQAAVMPKVEAIAPISALEMLTIRELKRMASRVGVRNYSSMRKGQLIEEILAKESAAA
jgi:hypothetical protein